MFIALVSMILCITYRASRRNRSAADYYAAGDHITSFQDGLAIAGDYMSTTSFLGIPALVFAPGYDDLIYSIGFPVGWSIILFLVVERPRNLGKYTFADVVSYCLKQKQIRILSVCGSPVVAAFYLTTQMVGADKLVELLLGLNYHVAIVPVGILMVLYVLFGGMLMTTQVRIIKAVLLLSGALFTTIMVLKYVNFDVGMLFSEAIKVYPKGEAVMSPGGLVKDPISAFFLGFVLMFGTTGLPHALMHFFTVSDAKEARKSVFHATGFIGHFYILTSTIGFGAIPPVNTNSNLRDATDALIGGNNMVTVHPVDAVGSSLFLGFISAVTFAAVLAIVVGLTLAGTSTVSHDLYASVFKGGRANEKDELWVSKMTTVALDVVVIILGILFEKQNIVFIVGLAFPIATSCNFPVLLLSMYRKKLATRGAMIDGWMGLITMVDLMVLDPTIWVQILGHEKATYPYEYSVLFPTIVASVGIWFFFIIDKSAAADGERARFFPQFVRSQTDLDASGMVAH